MLRKLKKNPGTEPKTCEKGPKLGFEYLSTSKTSHCVHGIPTGGGLRASTSVPVRHSSPLPRPWLSHSKAERTGTAPMDRTVADIVIVPVCASVGAVERLCVPGALGCGGRGGGASCSIAVVGTA